MKKSEWESLIKKIEALPDEVVQECYRKAMRSVLLRISAEAKLRARSDNGELRNSIRTRRKINGTTVNGSVYTKLAYAPFVEFGTGPEGARNHEGISPNVNITYKSKPWFIPGKLLEKQTIEKYHFPEIKLKNGDSLYWTDGQKAQPFLYPAINSIEPQIRELFRKAVFRAMKKVALKGDKSNNTGEGS